MTGRRTLPVASTNERRLRRAVRAPSPAADVTFLSVADVVEALHVSRRYVTALIASTDPTKRLDSFLLGRRRLVRSDVLAAWMEAHS